MPASILNLKFKGNKSFVAFSNLADTDSLTKTWKVCSKVASYLEQGQRLENLSWRLWHLQSLMVESDNARSKREFKKLSKCMGDKLDKEKGRNIAELEAPGFRRNQSTDKIRLLAEEKERQRGENSANGQRPGIKRMQFTFEVDKNVHGNPVGAASANATTGGADGSSMGLLPVKKPDLKPASQFKNLATGNGSRGKLGNRNNGNNNSGSNNNNAMTNSNNSTTGSSEVDGSGSPRSLTQIGRKPTVTNSSNISSTNATQAAAGSADTLSGSGLLMDVDSAGVDETTNDQQQQNQVQYGSSSASYDSTMSSAQDQYATGAGNAAEVDIYSRFDNPNLLSQHNPQLQDYGRATQYSQQGAGGNGSLAQYMPQPTSLRFPSIFGDNFGPSALLYPTPTLATSLSYGDAPVNTFFPSGNNSMSSGNGVNGYNGNSNNNNQSSYVNGGQNPNNNTGASPYSTASTSLSSPFTSSGHFFGRGSSNVNNVGNSGFSIMRPTIELPLDELLNDFNSTSGSGVGSVSGGSVYHDDGATTGEVDVEGDVDEVEGVIEEYVQDEGYGHVGVGVHGHGHGGQIQDDVVIIGDGDIQESFERTTGLGLGLETDDDVIIVEDVDLVSPPPPPPAVLAPSPQQVPILVQQEQVVTKSSVTTTPRAAKRAPRKRSSANNNSVANANSSSSSSISSSLTVPPMSQTARELLPTTINPAHVNPLLQNTNNTNNNNNNASNQMVTTSPTTRSRPNLTVRTSGHGGPITRSSGSAILPTAADSSALSANANSNMGMNPAVLQNKPYGTPTTQSLSNELSNASLSSAGTATPGASLSGTGAGMGMGVGSTGGAVTSTTTSSAAASTTGSATPTAPTASASQAGASAGAGGASNGPGGVKAECTNCGATHTPLWRRGLNDELNCNACGLYCKLHKRPRPKSIRNSHGEGRVQAAQRQETVDAQCYNCHTMATPLWRKDDEGKTVCNACGLYYKLHGSARPISMKSDVIRKRSRHDTRRISGDAPSASPGASRRASPAVTPQATRPQSPTLAPDSSTQQMNYYGTSNNGGVNGLEDASEYSTSPKTELGGFGSGVGSDGQNGGLGFGLGTGNAGGVLSGPYTLHAVYDSVYPSASSPFPGPYHPDHIQKYNLSGPADIYPFTDSPEEQQEHNDEFSQEMIREDENKANKRRRMSTDSVSEPPSSTTSYSSYNDSSVTSQSGRSSFEFSSFGGFGSLAYGPTIRSHNAFWHPPMLPPDKSPHMYIHPPMLPPDESPMDFLHPPMLPQDETDQLFASYLHPPMVFPEDSPMSMNLHLHPPMLPNDWPMYGESSSYGQTSN